ncbi:hypothetical protein NDA12_005325 [Ustilago hordei]|nr:hypothetical protein NDA15_002615 [Ustilago hordei]KAJ1577300.1 hypothetical protein NDA12_005325 [Ustilago hordei]
MFNNFAILVAAVIAAAGAVSAAQINTPASLTQCQPILLTWTGAQGKTYVKVLPANQPSATPLLSFAPQDAGLTSLKWVPNLPANTQVSFAISDDSGETNYSAPATILAGQDTACLDSNGSAAAEGSTATTGSSGSSGSSGSAGSAGSSGSSGSSGSAGSAGSSGSSGSAGSPGSSGSAGSPSSSNSGSSSSGSSSPAGSSSGNSGSASSSNKAPAASGSNTPSSSKQSSGATSNAASMVGTGLAVAAAAVAVFA